METTGEISIVNCQCDAVEVAKWKDANLGFIYQFNENMFTHFVILIAKLLNAFHLLLTSTVLSVLT